MVPLLTRYPTGKRLESGSTIIKAEELGEFGLAQFPMVIGGIFAAVGRATSPSCVQRDSSGEPLHVGGATANKRRVLSVASRERLSATRPLVCVLNVASSAS